ncbi:spore coat protein [Mesobacillus stamsii]|uniref:Spore coat protein X n=1 Tax=Mesobacillus stamsii TaxID=225347 RepID=A0ABU0FPN9_9BACI|nr:spore coat protein [Mesobacillus stamsii]MDQ0411868.1 spore coat protein X [Mesobacillus stamsii]
MRKEKTWRALDYCDCETEKANNQEVTQEAEQKLVTKQQSFEWIIIKDSEDVDVHTTDTQAAVSLQLGLQAAIAAVITISLGDSEKAKAVVNDINQVFKTKQRNVQKMIIEGSKHVEIRTTDTDVAVNIQALLQILVTLIAKLDIL